MQSRLRCSPLFTLLSVALAMSSLAAAGCDSSAQLPSDDDGAVEGSIAIPLVSTAPDGVIYRLSGATFEINSAHGQAVLDGNIEQPSLTVELPPGLISVFMRPTWVLTRSTDGGNTFTQVSALLGSLNPQSYRVLADTASTISFDFLVRNPNGMLTVRFGVDSTPRQLAGGIRIVNNPAPTGRLAPYANHSFDFSTYFSLYAMQRRTEADGAKSLVYQSGATAAEFYNDPQGLFAGEIGASYTGGYIEYQLTAKTDGTQELSGTFYGSSYPFSELAIGPHTMRFAQPLDEQGFPIDAYFHEVVPYSLTLYDDEQSTAYGTLVLRNLLPGQGTP